MKHDGNTHTYTARAGAGHPTVGQAFAEGQAHAEKFRDTPDVQNHELAGTFSRYFNCVVVEAWVIAP